MSLRWLASLREPVGIVLHCLLIVEQLELVHSLALDLSNRLPNMAIIAHFKNYHCDSVIIINAYVRLTALLSLPIIS